MADLLEIGQKVPNFSLEDIDGNGYELYYELGKGPRVVVFRRGGW